MNTFTKVAAAAVCAAALSAGAASAQNWSLNPLYGSTSLNAGFMPDPVTVNITAGGSNNFSGGGCGGGGWFADAPDYRLHYNAGQYQLTFYVRSNADTLLLINDPSANWSCNDDAQGLNPALTYRNPSSGQYDIWVGTYGQSTAQSRLFITEMAAFSN